MSNGAAKVIVVTGATRGLGEAMTAGFIDAGHTLAGCGRTESAVASLKDRYGDPHRFSVVDVSDDSSVAAWAKQTLAELGPPDVICNNAALVNTNANLWDVPVDEFSDVIDVNIKGVTNVIRHFLPAMIERGRGVVVNFSSGWGRSTSAEVAPYCATKWAIEGLTQALAQELPAGLAAVPLNPGIINTEMLQSCFGGSASDFPDANRWAQSAVPFLLGLGPADNGEQRTVHM